MPDTSGFPEFPIGGQTGVEPVWVETLPAPPRAVARPKNRPTVHLTLLLATSYTVTLAGALAEAARMNPASLPSASQLLSPSFLALGLPYSLCLLAILGCHEMGHYIACRRYGVDASLPYFLPSIPIPIGTFGAFIRIREPFPNRNVLFDVGVAGPLAGFVVMVPILIYGLATAHQVPIPTGGGYYTSDVPLILTWLDQWIGSPVPTGYTLYLSGPLMAAWVGCLVTAINLFPIGQLDGGHICYAISSLFHRRASLAGIAGFIVLGLLVAPSWLFFATLLLFFGPRHPPLIDESRPLSAGRMLVALLALLILLICFIPRPLSPVES